MSSSHTNRIIEIINSAIENAQRGAEASNLAKGPFVKISEVFNDYRIEAKVTSTSKAARNDPKPQPNLQELLQMINDDDDDDGENSREEDDNSEAEDGGALDEDDYEDDRSEYDEDHEFKWLEKINVKVIPTSVSDTGNRSEVVAHCHAKLIRRGQIRQNFYEELEQPSRETSLLAFDLFDRYGRFRADFKTHAIKKGSGVWSEELDHGDLLLIEEVFVKKNLRRQQIGCKMLEVLLKLVSQKSASFHSITWPSMLSHVEQEWDSSMAEAEKDRMRQGEDDRAIAFWRSAGFRRVGNTIWFAMTTDLEHASHKVMPSNDYDPLPAAQTKLHPHLLPFEEICNPPSVWNEYGQVLPPAPNYLEVLQQCLDESADPDACWTSSDAGGNTILHLAAKIRDPHCIQWILRGNFGPQLLRSHNRRGESPLDTLEFELEKLRTQKQVRPMMIQHVSDQFAGYNENAVRCLILLKGLGSLEALRQSGDVDMIQQLTGGCTCGKCLEGYLSPRMSHALLAQAQTGYDLLVEDIDASPGLDWAEANDEMLSYLPPSVQINLTTNKSMRRGFANLWRHIAICLQHGLTPSVANVLNIIRNANEWPPHTKTLLDRGGAIESAFLSICDGVIQQNEWLGDGEYSETSGTHIAKLPMCRNDLEFAFVCRACGYRRMMACSPY